MGKDMAKEVANTFKCAMAVHESLACRSEFQDKRYGKNVRVFTKLADKSVGNKCCTVCGHVE